MNTAIRQWSCTILLAATSACASAGTSAPATVIQGRPIAATRLETVSADELRGSIGSTAYELLQTNRPTWLRSRNASNSVAFVGIAVYLDGHYMGGLDALHQIPRSWIASAERLNGTRATQAFGTGHGDGAIVISTSRRTRL